MLNKILIITGPTATGKTALATALAKKFSGEIISADSRQVYKFMDIGTGKDREEYEKAGIPIWGIDLVEPDYSYNVSDWRRSAQKAVEDIWSWEKLPVVVGGTGMYLKALLDPFATIDIKPDAKLRQTLQNYSVEQLQKMLQCRDPQKLLAMNQSDRNNHQRLIRAIEIASQIQKSKIKIQKFKSKIKNFSTLIIGLTAPLSEIYRQIDQRVEDRIKKGMLNEVQKLITMGYSWDSPALNALGYKEFRDNLLATSPQQLATSLSRWKLAEHQYAKRQLTYQKKYLSAEWFDITAPDYPQNVFARVEKWYYGS